MQASTKIQILANHGISTKEENGKLLALSGSNADGSDWWEDITMINTKPEVYIWLGYDVESN